MAEDSFNGKNALITGGMGFIGSNLAAKLAGNGADVTILDAMIEGLGGNQFNIHDIKNKIKAIAADVRDKKAVAEAVKGKDFIFHLAGQVDHHRSVGQPFEDLDIRCNGTLTLLEECRKNNDDAKIVYSGTRAEYGAVKKLPASEEETPAKPIGMYAITSLAAENMMLMYNRLHGTRSCCLRITNTYGPRHQMKKPYGIVNWFIRLAMEGKPITVMGDGKTLRDYLYVEDCCDALMAAAAASEKSEGETFNAATGTGLSFLELAKEIIKANGRGDYKLVPYPDETKQLEPGSFVADIGKIRKLLRWTPKTPLSEGLKATIAFYRKNKQHYW
ncbi:SDR family NAD(P)-dependent oxidoreductase [Candidatus Woesearchaeota archaeon]|nr:SDR family NAD(P)-dependent oxidoreductase [Candidatus Woesearchaeota archaeon]